jgi:hypothetical protein
MHELHCPTVSFLRMFPIQEEEEEEEEEEAKRFL